MESIPEKIDQFKKGTHVSLSYRRVSLIHVTEMSDALMQNDCIESITLWHCAFEEVESFQLLCRVLATRPKLSTVVLGHPNVDVSLLSVCRFIHTLSVKQSHQTPPEPLIVLVESLPRLRDLTLKFGYNTLSLGHLCRLNTVLESTGITTFYMDSFRFLPEAEPAIGLLVTSKLTRFALLLDITNNSKRVGKLLVAALIKHRPRLHTLRLDGMSIDQSTFTVLSNWWLTQLACLRCVELGKSFISKEMMPMICDVLAEHGGLEKVALACDRYSEALLRLIRVSKKLRVVTLRHMHVDDDDDIFLRALASNTSVRTLRISSPEIFAKRLFSYNGWITKFSCDARGAQRWYSYTNHNKDSHKATKRAVYATASCLKRLGVVKDVRNIITNLVWASRGEVGVWKYWA